MIQAMCDRLFFWNISVDANQVYCRASPYSEHFQTDLQTATLNLYEQPCFDPPPTPPNGIYQRPLPFPPQFNTVSSTFKMHQHPQTYGQRHVVAIGDGPTHYGTIGGDRCIISYHKGGARFPAHSAALSCHNRTTDYGYFTDDRRHSDTDSNSPTWSGAVAVCIGMPRATCTP